MAGKLEAGESRVAVLVDCDNVQPAILDHALRFVAQFGRVVVRRGYGNSGTLGGGRWQTRLIELAFTPCLQYQYASGKNTADIALALDAMEMLFDEIVDTFCLVTSDSDFAHLSRKLRERGALVCIVGEEKTPLALRNASDHFSEWEQTIEAVSSEATKMPAESAGQLDKPSETVRPTAKQRPMVVVRAVAMLAGDSPEGKVDLGSLGHYMRRTDPSFTPKQYGHSGLLDMLRTYDLLKLHQEPGGHWTVTLDQARIQQMSVNPLTGEPSLP
ncbi:MAG: NYN domain-containing protein [Luteimonas sp.]|nr:NYN domain-containing protein [Luteimonas sp.]